MECASRTPAVAALQEPVFADARRARVPLRPVVLVSERSWGSAPMWSVTS